LSLIDVQYRKPLRGEIETPPDKSISHRAIILASLSEGKSIIRNFLFAEDPLRTITVFRQMGIGIKERDGEIVISGNGLQGIQKSDEVLDCGNSGTTMRLLSGVLAGQPFSSTLTGDSSLLARPMQRIITPLTEMGAVINSGEGGYPPLTIHGGRLKPITYASPVASAQVKSAVLLAGLYCDGVTSVIEPGVSRDHTERMLRDGGADINVMGREVRIRGKARLHPLDITIPGDFSSAAFFLVAGVLVPGSDIVINNTGINPTRTGLIEILEKMGAHIQLKNRRMTSGEPVADICVKHSQLLGVDMGSEMVLKAIDEFPILCVAASRARGTTRITGAKELRVKESDRIASMANELKKMGIEIEELEGGIIIHGSEQHKPATINSHGDHRIAMAMVVAGLLTDGITRVNNTECINTSFPGFRDALEKLTM
jgi:3-phosphoshikimate 1-carboxyvinyltransferase